MRFGTPGRHQRASSPRAPDADRAVRYLAKYLTKSVADTYADPEHPDPGYEAHIDRLHQRAACSCPARRECANWLRYGVQPKSPDPA